MAPSTDSNVCDNYELIATAIRDQFQTGERGTKNLIDTYSQPPLLPVHITQYWFFDMLLLKIYIILASTVSELLKHYQHHVLELHF